MSDLNYDVTVRYLTSGDPTAKIGAMTKKLEAANKESQDLGKSITAWGNNMTSAVDSVTGPLERVGSMFAKIGAAAAVGGMALIYKGVTGINNELESLQISLAGTFQAQGYFTTLDGAMVRSGQVIKDMRRDARELPGEFKDISSIFNAIAISGSKTGMSIDQIRKLSAQTMAFGAMKGIHSTVTGREMSHLLEGTGHSNNLLGQRILGPEGMKAANKMAPRERQATIKAALDKYNESIGLHKDSFAGLSSTLVDNLKLFLGNSTETLFKKVKGTLSSVNDWFENNSSKTEYWANRIGNAIADAWNYGTKKIAEWLPAMENFAADAHARIKSIIESIKPFIDMLGGGSGSILDKIAGIMTLYSGLKIGGAVAGAAGSAASLGSSAASGLGLVGAEAGAMGGAAGLVGLAAAATIAATALGQLSAMADKNSTHHEQAMRNTKSLSANFERLTTNLESTLLPGFESFGVGMTKFASGLLQGLADISSPMESLRVTLNRIHIPEFLLKGTTTASTGAGDLLEEALHGRRTEMPVIDRNMDVSSAFHSLKSMPSEPEKKPPVAPNHTTNIHKVEIIVKSNEDPSRIARLTREQLVQLSRNPTSSKTKSFSVGSR